MVNYDSIVRILKAKNKANSNTQRFAKPMEHTVWKSIKQQSDLAP